MMKLNGHIPNVNYRYKSLSNAKKEGERFTLNSVDFEHN